MIAPSGSSSFTSNPIHPAIIRLTAMSRTISAPVINDGGAMGGLMTIDRWLVIDFCIHSQCSSPDFRPACPRPATQASSQKNGSYVCMYSSGKRVGHKTGPVGWLVSRWCG